jgi:fructose-1,6-bisphosphatase/inositol monophosphatase family enzyme
MQTTDIADLIVDASDRIVLPRFRALAAGEVIEKRPGDFVTVADRETEAFLTAHLAVAYPDAAILGEEMAVVDDTVVPAFDASDHGFVMDPIDGTKNFVNGSPDFAVMLAETRSGIVVRSWIWQPIHKVMYISERGKGATRNGVPMRPAPVRRPYRGVGNRHWVGETFGGRAEPVTLQAMCTGVDYPRLAEGGQDFIIFRGQNAWDHLPGIGVIHELGGVARTYEGDDYGPGTKGSYLLIARTDEVWQDLRDKAPAPH